MVVTEDELEIDWKGCIYRIFKAVIENVHKLE
jgi:hypothetical protein